MRKLLIKWFMPSDEALAELCAKSLAKFINSTNKSDSIAKYNYYIDQITAVQSKIVAWLRDGKISENEEKELADLLLPLTKKIKEII